LRDGEAAIMTTDSATSMPALAAGRLGRWLAGALAAALLLTGLAGYLSAGWGFALLLFAGLSVGVAFGLFAVLVFSRRGDTDRLLQGSKASFAVGAAAYVAAVCALAGYYGYETLQSRMELHWIIFGPLVVWALIAFDSGIYAKVVRKNLPTWHRFKRFIRREDSDPDAMRRTAVNDIILQRSLFRTSKLRWLRHALIFWGFAAMFATELAAVVVRDAIPAFGWHDVWREPGHPVRLAFDLVFDITGLMVMVGCVIALGWRLSVRGKPERRFADSPMSAFLLFVVVSGFVVDGWRIAQTPSDASHAWSLVGLGFARAMGAFGSLPAGAYAPLWLVHVIAACALIGYLPATRLVHTCATPVGRLMNSQIRLLAARKIGVLGGLMSRGPSAPARGRLPSIDKSSLPG
jgi:nitrate reductase gamma subunit